VLFAFFLAFVGAGLAPPSWVSLLLTFVIPNEGQRFLLAAVRDLLSPLLCVFSALSAPLRYLFSSLFSIFQFLFSNPSLFTILLPPSKLELPQLFARSLQ
jgi:hypothetical protein